MDKGPMVFQRQPEGEGRVPKVSRRNLGRGGQKSPRGSTGCQSYDWDTVPPETQALPLSSILRFKPGVPLDTPAFQPNPHSVAFFKCEN